MKSLNQIIAELQTFANVHYQIHTFGHGDVWEATPNSSEIVYPILWLVPNGATTGVNEVTTNFTVLCMDLVRSGEENETEVLSDTLQIILDVVSYYRQQHNQTYIVEFGSQIQPFTESHPDMLAGHSITVSIRQPFTYNECAIPFSGAPTPLVPTCAAATIQNAASNPTYQASIASGANLVLPQVKVLDSDGVTPILANYIPNTDGFVATCSAPTCADVTEQINGVTIGTSASGTTNNQVIENTLGTPVGTAANPSVVPDARVGANGIYLAQVPATVDSTIDVHDTAGSDVGSENSGTWEIADSTVNVNGILFDTVVAEGTLNVPVEYANGTPVGTITGGVVEIPDPITCASIAVSVSDANPNFGETITITATPTGISPTNYKFYYCTNDDLYEIADQAGNSYDWLVNQIGSITIVVIATYGVLSFTDSEDIVATTVFPLDLFSGATECNFLQLMTSSYTGALCTIRRSSDNALKDFYPEFVTLTLNSTDGSGTTLGDWIGANSGYIYRLYSQVGGQDILITTVNEQPRIVNAGVLEVDTNGLASAYFDGTNNVYTLNSLAGEARVDAYIVLNSSSNFIVPFGTGSTYSFVGQNGSPSTSLYSNAGTPLLYANNSLQSPTTRGDVWTASGGSQKIITHEALNTSTWANFRIMNYVGAATQGKLAGIIAWTSDNSSQRSAFITALNAFLNTIY